MKISEKNKPPKVAGIPLLGSTLSYVKNPMEFYKNVEKQYGDIARFKLAHLSIYAIFNPKDMKHVLVDNAHNYNKSSSYKYLKGVLGNGMLTADQNDWEWRRKTASPSFTKSMLHTYGIEMAKIIEDYAVRWKEKYAIGEVFSVFKEMNSLSLEIAGATMFGSRLSKYSATLSENLSDIMFLLEKRITTLAPPLWIPVPYNRQFIKVQKALMQTITEILKEAQEKYNSGREIPLLVQTLIEQEKEKGRADRWSILDEAITYLVAGHETTGSALSWAWYLISQHPEVEERLDSEVKKVLGARAATMDDIPKLVYTSQIAHETLRLYPSIWTFGRSNIQEDELSGYRIPPKTDIAITPYVVHRNPKYWEDPEKFEPDRFAPEKEKDIDKLHYFPFATGPRNCIGHKFALQEMVLVLATFARLFRLRLKENFVAVPEVLVAMRPGGGMPMWISEKKK